MTLMTHEIKALLDAVKLPWQLKINKLGATVYDAHEMRIYASSVWPDLARLIAAAPDLAAEVIRLRADNEQLRQRIEALSEANNAARAALDENPAP